MYTALLPVFQIYVKLSFVTLLVFGVILYVSYNRNSIRHSTLTQIITNEIECSSNLLDNDIQVKCIQRGRLLEVHTDQEENKTHPAKVKREVYDANEGTKETNLEGTRGEHGTDENAGTKNGNKRRVFKDQYHEPKQEFDNVRKHQKLKTKENQQDKNDKIFNVIHKSEIKKKSKEMDFLMALIHNYVEKNASIREEPDGMKPQFGHYLYKHSRSDTKNPSSHEEIFKRDMVDEPQLSHTNENRFHKKYRGNFKSSFPSGLDYKEIQDENSKYQNDEGSILTSRKNRVKEEKLVNTTDETIVAENNELEKDSILNYMNKGQSRMQRLIEDTRNLKWQSGEFNANVFDSPGDEISGHDKLARAIFDIFDTFKEESDHNTTSTTDELRRIGLQVWTNEGNSETPLQTTRSDLLELPPVTKQLQVFKEITEDMENSNNTKAPDTVLALGALETTPIETLETSQDFKPNILERSDTERKPREYKKQHYIETILNIEKKDEENKKGVIHALLINENDFEETGKGLRNSIFSNALSENGDFSWYHDLKDTNVNNTRIYPLRNLNLQTSSIGNNERVKIENFDKIFNPMWNFSKLIPDQNNIHSNNRSNSKLDSDKDRISDNFNRSEFMEDLIKYLDNEEKFLRLFEDNKISSKPSAKDCSILKPKMYSNVDIRERPKKIEVTIADIKNRSDSKHNTWNISYNNHAYGSFRINNGKSRNLATNKTKVEYSTKKTSRATTVPQRNDTMSYYIPFFIKNNKTKKNHNVTDNVTLSHIPTKTPTNDKYTDVKITSSLQELMSYQPNKIINRSKLKTYTTIAGSMKSQPHTFYVRNEDFDKAFSDEPPKTKKYSMNSRNKDITTNTLFIQSGGTTTADPVNSTPAETEKTHRDLIPKNLPMSFQLSNIIDGIKPKTNLTVAIGTKNSSLTVHVLRNDSDEVFSDQPLYSEKSLAYYSGVKDITIKTTTTIIPSSGTTTAHSSYTTPAETQTLASYQDFIPRNVINKVAIEKIQHTINHTEQYVNQITPSIWLSIPSSNTINKDTVTENNFTKTEPFLRKKERPVHRNLNSKALNNLEKTFIQVILRKNQDMIKKNTSKIVEYIQQSNFHTQNFINQTTPSLLSTDSLNSFKKFTAEKNNFTKIDYLFPRKQNSRPIIRQLNSFDIEINKKSIQGILKKHQNKGKNGTSKIIGKVQQPSFYTQQCTNQIYTSSLTVLSTTTLNSLNKVTVDENYFMKRKNLTLRKQKRPFDRKVNLEAFDDMVKRIQGIFRMHRDKTKKSIISEITEEEYTRLNMDSNSTARINIKNSSKKFKEIAPPCTLQQTSPKMNLLGSFKNKVAVNLFHIRTNNPTHKPNVTEASTLQSTTSGKTMIAKNKDRPFHLYSNLLHKESDKKTDKSYKIRVNVTTNSPPRKDHSFRVWKKLLRTGCDARTDKSYTVDESMITKRPYEIQTLNLTQKQSSNNLSEPLSQRSIDFIETNDVIPKLNDFIGTIVEQKLTQDFATIANEINKTIEHKRSYVKISTISVQLPFKYASSQTFLTTLFPTTYKHARVDDDEGRILKRTGVCKKPRQKRYQTKYKLIQGLLKKKEKHQTDINQDPDSLTHVLSKLIHDATLFRNKLVSVFNYILIHKKSQLGIDLYTALWKIKTALKLRIVPGIDLIQELSKHPPKEVQEEFAHIFHKIAQLTRNDFKLAALIWYESLDNGTIDVRQLLDDNTIDFFIFSSNKGVNNFNTDCYRKATDTIQHKRLLGDYISMISGCINQQMIFVQDKPVKIFSLLHHLPVDSTSPQYEESLDFLSNPIAISSKEMYLVFENLTEKNRSVHRKSKIITRGIYEYMQSLILRLKSITQNSKLRTACNVIYDNMRLPDTQTVSPPADHSHARILPLHSYLGLLLTDPNTPYDIKNSTGKLSSAMSAGILVSEQLFPHLYVYSYDTAHDTLIAIMERLYYNSNLVRQEYFSDVIVVHAFVIYRQTYVISRQPDITDLSIFEQSYYSSYLNRTVRTVLNRLEDQLNPRVNSSNPIRMSDVCGTNRIPRDPRNVFPLILNFVLERFNIEQALADLIRIFFVVYNNVDNEIPERVNASFVDRSRILSMIQRNNLLKSNKRNNLIIMSNESKSKQRTSTEVERKTVEAAHIGFDIEDNDIIADRNIKTNKLYSDQIESPMDSASPQTSERRRTQEMLTRNILNTEERGTFKSPSKVVNDWDINLTRFYKMPTSVKYMDDSQERTTINRETTDDRRYRLKNSESMKEYDRNTVKETNTLEYEGGRAEAESNEDSIIRKETRQANGNSQTSKPKCCQCETKKLRGTGEAKAEVKQLPLYPDVWNSPRPYQNSTGVKDVSKKHQQRNFNVEETDIDKMENKINYSERFKLYNANTTRETSRLGHEENGNDMDENDGHITNGPRQATNRVNVSRKRPILDIWDIDLASLNQNSTNLKDLEDPHQKQTFNAETADSAVGEINNFESKKIYQLNTRKKTNERRDVAENDEDSDGIETRETNENYQTTIPKRSQWETKVGQLLHYRDMYTDAPQERRQVVTSETPQTK